MSGIFFHRKYRVAVIKIRILKNPKYPTQIFQVTRMPRLTYNIHSDQKQITRNTIFKAKAEHDCTKHTIFSKTRYTPWRFGLWEIRREERGGRGHTRWRRRWVSSCGRVDGRWRRRLEADSRSGLRRLDADEQTATRGGTSDFD
jgi:hypothetical protein